MAVGDTVTLIQNAASAVAYFQPAAGVSVLVTSFDSETWSAGGVAYRTDGANSTMCGYQYIFTAPYTNPFSFQQYASKIVIDNTNYWGMYSTGYTGITGFEVK